MCVFECVCIRSSELILVLSCTVFSFGGQKEAGVHKKKSVHVQASAGRVGWWGRSLMHIYDLMYDVKNAY